MQLKGHHPSLSRPHAILAGAKHVCRGTFSSGLMQFNYDP